MEKKIIIIGAGPTGLGAAYRLQELGYKNWSIYEKNDYVGGLSASFKDRQGFTWDLGGHVLFSHYKYFDDVVQKLLGNDYFEHQRESWIRIMNRWVPYPFQNNIRRLPTKALLECLLGLYKVSKNNHRNSRNFKEWILNIFGKGIAKYFMIPYNSKVWATPLELMDKGWIAERISIVDFGKVLTNVVLERDDISWGPNNVFKFPLYGGIGGLFNKIVSYINDNLFTKKEVIRIDFRDKNILFSDGSSLRYDVLINTSPIDNFIEKLDGVPKIVKKVTKDLVSNSVYVVGIGLKRKLQSSKYWMYFPEDNSPFYRVTHFSNYSPYNVPGGKTKEFCSYMCETSFSESKPVDMEQIIETTIQGLINTNMLKNEDRKLIVSTHLSKIDKAYPVPTLKRDRALAIVQNFLEKNSICSRGRFGAWLYEVGNMDHSFMMGVECIEAILKGGKEKVFKSKTI